MKKLYTLFFVALSSVTFAQTTITQWNFDGSSTAATIGTGTIALIGGVTENLQTSGTTPCNCPYVAGNPSTGKSYTTTTYAAQSTASGTTGIQFNVSTATYSNIYVYVDVYGSKTASKYVQLQYTTNGSTWINSGTPTIVPYTTSSQWVTLSGAMPAAAANNPNFAFRVVSVFDPTTGGTSYSPVNLTSTYAVTGALRYDNVMVTNGILSVNQNSISGLSIFPNPVTNGVLYINTSANAEKTLTVYDVLGKQVLNTTTSESAINVSNLNAGIYIVKINEEGNTATRKLIIR